MQQEAAPSEAEQTEAEQIVALKLKNKKLKDDAVVFKFYFKAQKLCGLLISFVGLGIAVALGLQELLIEPGQSTCQDGAPCDQDSGRYKVVWNVLLYSSILQIGVLTGPLFHQMFTGLFHEMFGRPQAAAPLPAAPPAAPPAPPPPAAPTGPPVSAQGPPAYTQPAPADHLLERL